MKKKMLGLYANLLKMRNTSPLSRSVTQMTEKKDAVNQEVAKGTTNISFEKL